MRTSARTAQAAKVCTCVCVCLSPLATQGDRTVSPPLSLSPRPRLPVPTPQPPAPSLAAARAAASPHPLRDAERTVAAVVLAVALSVFATAVVAGARATVWQPGVKYEGR